MINGQINYNEKINYIEPLKVFGGQLLNIEKPARYTGGEIGSLADKNKLFRTLIAFPDLYEIGMGNNAVKIIYNYINSLPDVSCDRAFAPAPDFEKVLRNKNIPLYGLDTGISFCDLDILMFTIGYELGLNGVLTMLDVSAIPLHCKDRSENHPLVIAGGPAVSNPLPYSPFIDAFWIGEAEAGFFDLIKEIAKAKKNGQGRALLFSMLSSHPNIWVKGKEEVKRAVFFDFSDLNIPQNPASPVPVYPIPSMKIIQNHGSIEIMRGCPNGCRFCHAGFWYRPARQKSIEQIISEVNEIITKGGWQQISLSSLSSGDFTGIDILIDNLNSLFGKNHVSFQLPSLKVSSFALSILEKISFTRKSGLTFAVETPDEQNQLALNKEVTRDSITAILEEAKKKGWKGAKFYFMVGLPLQEKTGINSSSEEEIVSFISDISRRTRMNFNINIGIFIPKPHTPYQWSNLDIEESEKKLFFLKSKIKSMGHKVSVSDSLMSCIEGLISRGDERAGFLCEKAFKSGSRLDPWGEYINREKWHEILKENSDYLKSIFNYAYNPNKELPWKHINSCINNEYLVNEYKKSKDCKRTPSCKEKCSLCGVCKGFSVNTQLLEVNQIALNESVVSNNNENTDNVIESENIKKSDPDIYRVLFSFCKKDSAVFHGHLSLIEIFSMSLRRAGVNAMYTGGFNPLAKMEFASPLSTGISAENEIAVIDFLLDVNTENFIDKLNNNLPAGIIINKAKCYLIKSGLKKHSLSSLLWGFAYKNNGSTDYINAVSEKQYRQKFNKNTDETDKSYLFNLTRSTVLAKDLSNSSGSYISYFDAYDSLYLGRQNIHYE
ncbi:MAG: TIGR03936 family radical SAM-associated protein [Treponema sp.]|nr:TIGR03936 family radical SAM-associated protein [Treponema sp.]